jgi:hypothetical protein
MPDILEIKSKSGLTDKQFASLSKEVVRATVQSLYQTGHITDADLLDWEKLKSKMLSLNKKAHWGFVIDHRENIIETARRYKKEKNYDYASLFYAIFFEHTINSIIERVCTREKIDRKIITEIIKNVSIDGKLNWLPKLLKIPDINNHHKGLIKRNADDRNSFVHYKFKAGHDDVKIEFQEEQKRISMLDNIEKTVIYIKKYESRIVYNNKKGLFKKNLKKYH